MFGFDASTVTIVQLVSIELTPARALSVAVEARDVDIYETLSLARLLSVRKGVSIWWNGQERG
jgi:hypothetical protein